MTTQEIYKELAEITKRIEFLKEELKTAESEPEFERKLDTELYWYVATNFGEPVIHVEHEAHAYFDDKCFENNNYFHTDERAQEVADKIRLLLKLERLYDTYCPDYKPNWLGNDLKYVICKQYEKHGWTYDYRALVHDDNAVQVYFPTKEIAQKVCDILNAELKQDSAH